VPGLVNEAALKDLLVCPQCRGELALEKEVTEGPEVLSGRLTCQGCKKDYVIEEGIPRMVINPSA